MAEIHMAGGGYTPTAAKKLDVAMPSILDKGTLYGTNGQGAALAVGTATIDYNNAAAAKKSEKLGTGHTESRINQIVDSIKQWIDFRLQYIDPNNACFRVAVNKEYMRIVKEQQSSPGGEKPWWWERNVTIPNFDQNNIHLTAANHVWRERLEWSFNALRDCLTTNQVESVWNVHGKDPNKETNIATVDVGGPFDRRLDRLLIRGSDSETETKIPFSTRYAESATSGYLMAERYMKDQKISDENITKMKEELKRYQQDLFYIGIPSLVNTYSLTKLYGSEGGSKLVNKRGQRKWYEIDQAFGDNNSEQTAYSMNPTTTSLINWGKADPYGRTPYHFTDFAFCKYWNKIENNRLITLRRFAAPILDNMKFPGMDGGTTPDKGSTTLVSFPPMATAITYFGEETGNSLNQLLKFTTGLNWDEAEADVWKVTTEYTPDAEAGPGKDSGFFGGLTSLSKMLNVAGGNWDQQAVLNKGQLPPDPYSGGPYENRILGPVNRIDKVKKRKAGLVFEWSGLNIQFEYVARPIGGINTKAVVLDILSNFLVMGSASAVFFGGQHRFMGNPAKYPFLGGAEGIEAWYSGKPLDWGKATIKQFVGAASDPNSSLAKSGSEFFNALFGGGGGNFIDKMKSAIGALLKPGAAGSNLITAYAAEKSTGQIPYLSGLKALLTGEPVGEWHVTIGNPLNPIALIGNLICTGVEVEFGEELGPDDFPTEIKFTVKLEHAMGRDRDGIQSIFNRGMGRIYDLPDSMQGSADGQSKVDGYTANANKTGTAAMSKGWLAGPSTIGSRSGPPMIKPLTNQGETSVWSPLAFRAVSPNLDMSSFDPLMYRSAYRAVDWIALKSLK